METYSKNELFRRFGIFRKVLSIVSRIHKGVDIREGIIRQISEKRDVIVEINMSRFWTIDCYIRNIKRIITLIRPYGFDKEFTLVEKQGEWSVRDCGSNLPHIANTSFVKPERKAGKKSLSKEERGIAQYLSEAELTEILSLDTGQFFIQYTIESEMIQKIRAATDALGSNIEIRFEPYQIVICMEASDASFEFFTLEKNPSSFRGQATLTTTPFILGLKEYCMEMFSSHGGQEVVVKLSAWIDKDKQQSMILWMPGKVYANTQTGGTENGPATD